MNKKNLLVLLVAFFVSAIVFAQRIQHFPSKPKQFNQLQKSDKKLMNARKQLNQSNHSRQSSTIYLQDFSGGIPAGWTQTPTPSGALWEYRGTATSPDNTVGSRGAYAQANDPILSPSGSNGFIIFDSDYLDNDGVSGNFGNGSAPSPHTGVITTDAIDCSGHPYVQLSFYNYFRQYSSLTVVGVSSDGSNFTYDTVNTSVDLNWSTYNADFIRLDISDVAANTPTVYLQFIFDGTSDPNGTNFPGYYFWMIDDIELTDLPINELVMEDNFVSFGGNYGYYNNTPVRQATPMTFGSALFNYGSATQTNVNLNVDISDGTSTLYNKNVSIASVPYQERDTLNIYNPYTPFVSGNYTVGFAITQNETDTFPINNSMVSNFTISDSVYARDNGDTANASSMGSHYYFGSFTYDFKIANLFEITNPDTITSISVFLTQGTEVGSQFTLQLLDSSEFHNVLLESDVFTVSSGDINSWVTLSLPPDGVNEILDPNIRYYYAAINIISTSGKVNVADDLSTPQPWYTGLIYIDSVYQTWYSNSNAPFIRMNLSPSAGGLKLPVADFFYDAVGLNANFYDYSANNPTTWLWEFGDGSTDTTQNPSHTYSTDGSYTVCLSVTNAIGGDSACSAPITFVSIREIQINSDNVNIYPNPTSGKFIIDNEIKSLNTEVEVLNIVGQIVASCKLNSMKEKSIDLSSQPNGIYFVKIKTQEGAATKKIVLSR